MKSIIGFILSIIVFCLYIVSSLFGMFFFITDGVYSILNGFYLKNFKQKKDG